MLLIPLVSMHLHFTLIIDRTYMYSWIYVCVCIYVCILMYVIIVDELTSNFQKTRGLGNK